MPQFDAWLNAKTAHAGAPAGNDEVVLVDASDTTEDAGGTVKPVAVSDLLAGTVKTTGDQTLAGVKTFSSPPVVPDGTAANHAASKGQLDALAQVDQAGTAYTLAAADAGKVVRMTAADAATVTVPANATVGFALGTVVNVYAAGAGGVTVAAATGVTIRNNSAALVQYAEVSLRKDAVDEWVRVG